MTSGQRFAGERVGRETRGLVLLHIIQKWLQDLGGEASPLMCPSSVSQCSAECGTGVRTRSVVCMTNHISSLPLEGCGNNRPAEATPCDNGPCTGKVEWFAGSWSQVSGKNWCVSLSLVRGSIAVGLGTRIWSIPGLCLSCATCDPEGAAYAPGAPFSQQYLLSTYYNFI